MEAKEKAKELVDRFTVVGLQQRNEGIQCAIIAANEILEALEEYDERTENYLKKDFPNYFSSELQNMEQDLRYWQEVKQEIEKLW
jgi:hypothetical protein